MKITRKQLRKLIMETMITPSTSVIKKILDDPGVDERLKSRLLRSDDEESINQALQLMSVLYPDKYGTIDTDIEGYTSTTKYEKEFNKTRATQLVETYISSFEDWFKQSVADLSDDLVEIFEAAVAYHFGAYSYHYGLDNTVADHNLLDSFFSHRYPLHEMIVAHYLNDVKVINKEEEEDLYNRAYNQLMIILGYMQDGLHVDLEPVVYEAVQRLREEDWIYYDDDNYLYVFAESDKWFADHPKYAKY